MRLASDITYNTSIGTFDGFVHFGDGITIVDDQDDTPAKDALVFMLVSLRGNWKYLVGYVLIDGIDATTLHALLQGIGSLAEYEIDVLKL